MSRHLPEPHRWLDSSGGPLGRPSRALRGCAWRGGCWHLADADTAHDCWVLAKLSAQESLAPAYPSDYAAMRPTLSDAEWLAQRPEGLPDPPRGMVYGLDTLQRLRTGYDALSSRARIAP
jgi:hypothetical protein